MLFSKRLYKLADTKILIIAIVIFIAFIAFVLPKISTYTENVVGENTPDLSFFYSSDDLYEMADDYGADGRRIYIILRATFDLIFPLIYLFFLVSVLSRLLSVFERKSKLRLLNLIPVAGGIFDYLENLGASIIMGRFPKKSPIVGEMTPYFTMIKWILIGISFMLIVILILYILFKYIKNKLNTKTV